MSKWSVVCEPEGKNPSLVEKTKASAGVLAKARAALSGSTATATADVAMEPENMGGMVVYVVNGSSKQEVSRVAWIRREGVCKNPDVSFDEQLRIEVGKAQNAAQTMNDLLTGAGELQ